MIKNDTIPTPPVAPAPELSPDMVRVKGRIIEVHPSPDNKSARITLRVSEFLGMGSSAPAVTSGDTIKVKVSNLPAKMKKDDLFVFDLKYRHILAEYRDTTPSWLYIKSKKIKKDK